MDKRNGKRMTDDTPNDNSTNLLTSAVSKPTTRREFLKIAGIGGAGVVALHLVGCSTAQKSAVQATTPAAGRQVYVANAKMVVLHDSTRCVGCRRCEVACTAFHDNKIQPSIARIKVARNFNYGPEGPRLGYARGQGLWGDYRLIADTCLQCPHPVPCLTSCPVGAIEVDPNTNARVINTQKCIGCQTCLKACPWAMTSYDQETQKATKCDLCGGDPQCVKVCPSGALTYVPRRDRSKDTPSRQVVPAYIGIPADVAATCQQCHQPSPAATK